jgi:hypothetical protein
MMPALWQLLSTIAALSIVLGGSIVLTGDAYAQTRPRFHVKNNCARDGVLVFNAGQSGSMAVQQWGTTFGPTTIIGNIVYNTTRIPAGDTVTFNLPLAGAVSGNMVLAYGCPEKSTGLDGYCLINFQDTLSHTIPEITAGCAYVTDTTQCNGNPGAPIPGQAGQYAPISPQDSIDVSAVNGYTLPVYFNMTNPSHTNFQYGDRSAIDTSMLDLASCAKEYGYNANELQTIGLVSEDKTTYPLTYALLRNPAYQSGISMATMMTKLDPLDNQTKTFFLSCSHPKFWLTSNSVGTPSNPQIMSQNANADISGKTPKDKLPPNTVDWYGCSNHGNQAICTDSSTSCTCTYPGCRGAQCSKGIMGNYRNLSVVYTNYVKTLKETRYQAYTWAYDDAQGGFGVAWTTDRSGDGAPLPDYLVTFCPAGGDPIVPSQKWSYSAASGNCIPNNAGAYASYHECLTTDATPKAQFYVVPDVILGFPNASIPNQTFNYCVWNGAGLTGATGPMDYDACAAKTYPSTPFAVVAPEVMLLTNE